MDVLEMGQLDESNGWKVMVFFKMENFIFKKEIDLAISPITGSPMSFLWFPLVDFTPQLSLQDVLFMIPYSEKIIPKAVLLSK